MKLPLKKKIIRRSQEHRLELFGRPKTIFDASNKKHRQYFMEFLETGSWRQSPVAFIIDDDSLSVTYCIQKKLNAYYFKKEFGEDHEFPMLERWTDIVAE